MPAKYKKWKAEVRAQLAEWWTDPPLDRVEMVTLKFKGPARADLDNLMGAILDCGNQLIWKDDRVSVISKLYGQFEKRKEADSQIELTLRYFP